jgi:LmbE family N-acetylglucosaminyl deacetylase
VFSLTRDPGRFGGGSAAINLTIRGCALAVIALSLWLTFRMASGTQAAREPGAGRTQPAVASTAALRGGARVAAPPIRNANDTAPAGPVGVLKLEPTTRLLIVAPHPDDEVIGAGGLIERAVAFGLPVHVIFVTSGDGYPEALRKDLHLSNPTGEAYVEMGEIRQREALRVLDSLGVGQDDVSFLGFPDGGLGGLWREYWSSDRPYRSPYTKQLHPPYAESVDQNVAYSGVALVDVLERVLRSFAPTLIVIPHPNDIHPDHAAAGEFAIEAVDNLQEDGTLRRDAEVVTYLVHHGLWPDSNSGATELKPPGPEWIPATDWLTFPLSDDERREKEAALRGYESQMEVMEEFLMRFVRNNELFGELRPAVQRQIAEVH